MNNEKGQYPQEDVGTVIEVEGKKVRVEVVRSGGCKTCSMQSFCFGRNTPAVFDVESELELKPGDRVELEIALFLGYLIGSIWLDELASIGIAFAATALSYIILKLIDRKFGKKVQVRIGRKL